MEKPTCEECPYFHSIGHEVGGHCCRFAPFGRDMGNIPCVSVDFHCPMHPAWDRYMKWWRKQSKKKNPCK